MPCIFRIYQNGQCVDVDSHQAVVRHVGGQEGYEVYPGHCSGIREWLEAHGSLRTRGSTIGLSEQTVLVTNEPNGTPYIIYSIQDNDNWVVERRIGWSQEENRWFIDPYIDNSGMTHRYCSW